MKIWYQRFEFAIVQISPDVPCGVVAHRIVGGSEAERHSIPWQVGLVQQGRSYPFCGGTLIGSSHVISAAHCTEGISDFNVLVGEHNITDENDGTAYSVESIHQHPSYDSSAFEYDFAIIKLREKVPLGNKAIHACLPTEELSDEFFMGSNLTVSGWGRLSDGGDASYVLHKVQVPFVPNDVCNEKYNGIINNVMLCAGNIENGGVDACQGDSGGKYY